MSLLPIAALFALQTAPLTQDAKLVAPVPEAGNRFGGWLDLDGDRLVVAEHLDDDLGDDSGSVTVFQRAGTSWAPIAQVFAVDASAGDNFGRSVSLAGRILAVGGETANGNTGAAWIFRLEVTGWAQEARLDPLSGGGGLYGHDVSADGDRVVVGSQGESAAYVYVRDPSSASWSLEARLEGDVAPLGQFGRGVSLQGDRLSVGAPAEGTGAAYVFDRTDTGWVRSARVTPSTGLPINFGNSVSLFGDTLAVGDPDADTVANQSGSAHVFVLSNGRWIEQAELLGSDLGASSCQGLHLELFGDELLAGAHEAFAGTGGSAYLFTRSGTQWTERAKLQGTDNAFFELFGVRVALHAGVTLSAAPRHDAPGEAGLEHGAVYEFYADVSNRFCFGNDACSVCPCGNDAAFRLEGGCLNSYDRSAVLVGSDSASVSDDRLRFDVLDAPALSFCVLVSGDTALPVNGSCAPGTGILSGALDGLRCVNGNVARHGVRRADAFGRTTAPWTTVISDSAWNVGQVRLFQVFYRDLPAPCGTGQNTTNAVSITVLP